MRDGMQRRQMNVLPIGDLECQQYDILVMRVDGRTNLVQLIRGAPGGRWEIVYSEFLGAAGTEHILDKLDLNRLEMILAERRELGDRAGSIILFADAANMDECEQCGRYLRDCKC